jgi:imidazolonepropionase-like amidohydrolase
LAITRVTVIDVHRGQRLPDHTVVVTGARITGVGPSRSIPVPAGARAVDGRGLYLMPGLFDAHVHLTEETGPFVPLYLAFGITAARDVGGYLDSLRALRARLSAGAEIGPRLYYAGGPIDGDPPRWAGGLYPRVPVVVRTPEEARAAVRQAKAAGVDFIKLYVGLTPLLLRTAVAEAHAQGLKATADLLTWSFAPESAAVAGLDGLEHTVPSASPLAWTRDSARMEHIVAALAARGTTLTSTLVLYDRQRAQLPTAAPTYRALPAALRQRSAEMLRTRGVAAQFEYACRTVRAFAARGGQVLAGTDSYFMTVYPGDVHRELELLVACGLTPAQALAAGTLNPARWLTATDSLGGIARGKLADLLLLGGDPLADIRNTQQIRAVVANGRLFDRAALDALLADPARAGRGAAARP